MSDETPEVHIPSGGLVSFVNRGLQEGQSQRATMQEARDAGLRFGDTTFRETWHHQEESILHREEALQHPMDRPLPDATFIESDWGRPGTYYTWLRQLSRIEGTSDILEQFFVVDSEMALSPDEAIAELQQRLADAETPNDTGKGLISLGFDVWGATKV